MTAKKDPALFVKMRPWQERFFPRVSFDGSACWVWVGAKNPHGYGVFAAGARGLPGDAPMAAEPKRSAPELAHRFLYKAMRGTPTGECLMHSCDRPECVNPWHLTDATLAENNADMFAKGRGHPTALRVATMRMRAARGQNQACSVLTDADVRRIRVLRSEGLSYAAIHRAIGKGRPGTIRDVLTGRTWGHVS